MTRYFLVLLLAVALLAVACGRQAPPSVDTFGACNMLGGASRAASYGGVETQPVTRLVPVMFPELRGAMLASPLPYDGDALLLLSTGGTVSLMRYDSIHWSLSLDPLVPGLASDSSGQIYAVSTGGEVIALRDSTVTWRRRFPSLATDPDSVGVLSLSIPLAVESGVVVATSRGGIDRLGNSGAPLWSIRRGATVMRTLAAAPEVGIVAAVTHNSYEMSDTIIALDPAGGIERWAAAVTGARILAGPAIVGDLIVVGAASRQADGNRAPYAVAFGLDGVERWRVPLAVMPRGIAGDAAGNIYISGSGVRRDFAGGAVVSLDAAGKERWKVMFESAVPAAPALSANWLYFISRQDGRTGLFTYSHDGRFGGFVPISTIPDVLPQPVITRVGQVVLAGLDQAVLVRGSN